MNPDPQLQFFDEHRDAGRSLVFAVVVNTRGSTYSKAGAHMLINENGVFRGMLSGGCLEGDLAIRAQQVLESGRALTVSYDLAADDALWGLGVGCDGMMQIVLKPLTPANNYAPFAAIAEILRGRHPGAVTIQMPGDAAAEISLPVSPPPQLLILGAGLDAQPVLRIASELGWRCTVADHRPAYLEAGDFSRAIATHCVPADELAAQLDLAQFAMAIVMSHHLDSDRSYLRQLAATDMRYVGLLGPANRRERLLAELGDQAAGLAPRLHGPAGIDIGGRGPEAIALSIVAEMQRVYADA